MIRFFHTADIHFGVENYGRIDPATGIHTRLLDFRNSFAQCVEMAIEENVDFFLFCGDAYKTAYPTPTQQKLLIEVFLKLYHAGIPVAIVVGNHDHPLSFGKAHALDIFSDLPVEGFRVFSKPGAHRLMTKNGPVQIVGIPWPMRHNLVTKEEHHFKDATELTTYISGRVGGIINHLAQTLDPSLPAVLAGHLTVSTGIFSGSEKCAVFGSDPIFLPSQLAIPPFDYVALGHLHRHQNLNKGGIPVVYAGSTERVDFGERKEAKGFCRVSLIKKGECTYEFVPLKVRPMIQVEVTLEPEGNQTEQILQVLAGYDIRDALLKIIYYVPEGKKDTVDLLAIGRACLPAHYVAGVLPVHAPEQRTRRSSVQIQLPFAELIDNYLQAKEFDKGMKEDLKRKAHELYEETTTPKEDA